VDYDYIENNEDNDEQYFNGTEEDKTEDQLEQYEQINPEEMQDKTSIQMCMKKTIMPMSQQLDHPEELHETAEDKEYRATEATRRSTQETRPIERLEPNMSGKLYMQQNEKEIFESNVDVQLEYRYNLVTQSKPSESQSKEYSPLDDMLMDRLIYDLNTKIVREGASFAQQYLLNKRLRIFGQKGRDASKKEMDQFHPPSCFTPMSTTAMT
jgi:hypothetical protein